MVDNHHSAVKLFHKLTSNCFCTVCSFNLIQLPPLDYGDYLHKSTHTRSRITYCAARTTASPRKPQATGTPSPSPSLAFGLPWHRPFLLPVLGSRLPISWSPSQSSLVSHCRWPPTPPYSVGTTPPLTYCSTSTIIRTWDSQERKREHES